MNTLREYFYQEKTFDLFENLVYFKNLKGEYILCNNSFCKYTNYKKEEIIGKTDFELFSDDDAKVFTTNDKSVLNLKQEQSFCEILTLEDDEKIFFESKKDVVLDDKKNPVAIIGISKDITKQKQYETLHLTTQKILEFIVKDSSLDEILLFIINETEKINSNMISSILLLDDKKEKFSQSFTSSLPDYYNDAVKTLIIAEGVGSCGTAAFTKKRVIVEDINTHPYWANYLALTKPLNLNACWSQPFFSKDNEVLGTFAIYYKKPKKPTSFELELIDSFSYLVSLAVNRHLRQKELKKQEDLITHQSRLVSLSNVLENIAHHWRQPLSLISTISSGMRIDYDLYLEDQEHYNKALDKITLTTQELSRTIDGFRDYFLQNTKKKEFNINQTFEKVLDVLEKRLENTDIKIVKNIEDITLHTYETEIIHILINLINNCIEAFENQNIDKPIIMIDIKEKDSMCIITIKDNAFGVEESLISKIFEPYFSTKDDKSIGIGLSLYIVHDLIKRHLEGIAEAKNSIFEYNNKEYKGLEIKMSFPKRV